MKSLKDKKTTVAIIVLFAIIDVIGGGILGSMKSTEFIYGMAFAYEWLGSIGIIALVASLTD